MTTSGWPGVRPDMIVVGSEGGIIGTVRELRGEDFLAERTLERDIYVPFGAVRTVLEDLVQLAVHSDEVDEMQWEHA